KKGKETYRRKTLDLKDTLEPRRFFREWLKYGIGEPPVILDTSLVNRSTGQLSLWLRNRGYYYASVRDTVIYKPKKKKAIVHYYIETGKPFLIDSIYYLSANSRVNKTIENYLSSNDVFTKKTKFDSDQLDGLRSKLARE